MCAGELSGQRKHSGISKTLHDGSRGLATKWVKSKGLTEGKSEFLVCIFYLSLETPLCHFCKKQNYCAFMSHLCALFLVERYYSPPFRQVISRLEYYVQFQAPQHKNSTDMCWNKSSRGPPAWLMGQWGMRRDRERNYFLPSVGESLWGSLIAPFSYLIGRGRV